MRGWIAAALVLALCAGAAAWELSLRIEPKKPRPGSAARRS